MLIQRNYAQSWTALFRAFSSHRQPSAIFSKVFPSCNFLLHNDDKQTQHVTIVFNVNQFYSFFSFVEGIPQLDKTLGRTGLTAEQTSWPNWQTLWLAQRQMLSRE